ncbi:hypothetical protein [Nocardia pseudovaccinii]|uniref:hypothetical protein n=1 Tax=Nocardia pseudovaccinii TaxID=189540 RepID=UPI0007A38F33|nr:hypothetical protein [Nocardia pseudovaccinii]
MTAHETASTPASSPLSGENDPFGDGQEWSVIHQCRDIDGRVVRVLYECDYIVESGGGRARVTERRWHDGEHESRDVEPLD